MSFKLLAFSEYKEICRELLTPHEQHEHPWDIDLETLKSNGYETLICDLDDTLVSSKQKTVALQHLNWVQHCKDLGFKVYFLSNNRSRKRMVKIANQIDCSGLFGAIKPLSFSLQELVQLFDIDITKTIVLGDQLLKDTVVAKWVKAYAILLKPIHKTSSLSGRLYRLFEASLLKFVQQ